jgi:hypothetical protein
MGVVILFVLPALFFVLLDLVIFGEPPPWVKSATDNVRRRLRPPEPVLVDPFDTLKVQHRLAALSDEIQWLEGDRAVFARAHRLRVAQSAYDALLLDACRLAGVELGEAGPEGPHVEREREELELASRGWLW